KGGKRMKSKRFWMVSFLMGLFLFAFATDSSRVIGTQQEQGKAEPINNSKDAYCRINPSSNCHLLSQYDQNYGFPQSIYVKQKLFRTFAYVASGMGGLLILDVTNPQKPKKVGICDDLDFARTVFVKRNKAYVGSINGLFTVDLTFPKAPKLVGNYSELRFINKICAKDDSLIVSSDYNGLSIFNIKKKTSPTLVATFNNYSSYYDFEIRDNLIFAVGGQFVILNITDVTNISKVSGIDVYASRIILDENLVYLLNHQSLVIINISNTSDPKIIFNSLDYNSDIIDAFKKGDILYALDCKLGIVLFNTSSNTITKIGTFYMLDNFNDFSYCNGRFYITSEYSGIRIVEIGSNSTELQWIGYFKNGGGYTEDVFIKDGLAFIANGLNGLQILDVSNPFKPKLIANPNPFEGSFDSIVLKDELVFLANKDIGTTPGITVFNISNPRKPEKLVSSGGVYGQSFNQLEVKGDCLFLVKSWMSMFLSYVTYLKIIKISDINNLTVVSEIFLGEFYVQAMTIKNDTLFITSNEGDFFAFNISNPSKIEEIVHCKLSAGGMRDIVIEGNYAFFACPDFGLRIFDIQNLSKPVEVGTLKTTEEDYFSGGGWIQFSNGYVFLTDITQGLLVIDVSNIQYPRIVGQFQNVPSKKGSQLILQDILVKENIIYLSAGLDGLIIVSFNGLVPPVVRRIIIRRSLYISLTMIPAIVAIIIYKRKKNGKKRKNND
ncbi:MAG: hypothetical protein DRO63_06120, partial [Candidatus Gerdarchaeota archaeon]